jgi:Flp pilus assembly pilin Flp
MRKIRHRRRGERGAAAVEFALVFTLIFLPLVLGAIDFGWYFFVSETVTNAAREGARAGSVIDPAPANVGNAVSEAQNTAQNYLVNGGLQAQGVSADRVWVPVWGVGWAEAIQVDIHYPVGSLTGFFSAIMPAESKARAVMRWQ